MNSLQGVFVFDSAPSRGSAQIASVDFATMSNGDKSFDARYLPDYKELRKGWLSAKNSNVPARFKREEMMLSAAMVRQRVVVDGATGFMQSKTWSVNPVTRRPVALRYRYYRGLLVVGGRVLSPHATSSRSGCSRVSCELRSPRTSRTWRLRTSSTVVGPPTGPWSTAAAGSPSTWRWSTSSTASPCG